MFKYPFIVLAIALNLHFFLDKKDVDPEFTEYVEQFEKDCNCDVNVKMEFSNLNLGYGDTQNETLGVCLYLSNTPKKIFIDKTVWDKVEDKLFKKHLIYHELGHCYLNRPHTEDMIFLYDGRLVPKSLMYPSMFYYEKELWDYYVLELFNSN